MIRGVFAVLIHGIDSGSWTFDMPVKWFVNHARLSLGSASTVRKALAHRGDIELIESHRYAVLDPA